METVTIASALSTASELLTAGWTFISANAILFGVCALALLVRAIHSVKSFF